MSMKIDRILKPYGIKVIYKPKTRVEKSRKSTIVCKANCKRRNENISKKLKKNRETRFHRQDVKEKGPSFDYKLRNRTINFIFLIPVYLLRAAQQQQ